MLAKDPKELVRRGISSLILAIELQNQAQYRTDHK